MHSAASADPRRRGAPDRRRAATPPGEHARVAEHRRHQHALEVRDGRGVVEAVGVGQRVAGDAGAARERPARCRAALARPSNPRASSTPAAIATTPAACAALDVGPERHHADQQHEHGRDPARERIDDPDLAGAQRQRERGEEAELERRRQRDVGRRGRLDVPAQRRERREHDHRDHQRGRGRRVGVRRAGEQQRPRGVQHRGAQREEDGGACSGPRGSQRRQRLLDVFVDRQHLVRARRARTCARPRCPPTPRPPSARPRPRSPGGSRPAPAARSSRRTRRS